METLKLISNWLPLFIVILELIAFPLVTGYILLKIYRLVYPRPSINTKDLSVPSHPEKNIFIKIVIIGSIVWLPIYSYNFYMNFY
jgi:hypothetical protein